MIRRNIAAPYHLNDLAMWFDAAQGVTYDAGGVSKWDDSSGNGRHLVQNGGSHKPAYNPKNDFFGGGPTVDWNTVGSGTRLDRTKSDDLPLPMTILACASMANLSANEICLFNNTSGTQLGFGRANGALWLFSAENLTYFPTPPLFAVNKPFTLALLFAGPSDCKVLINGNAVVARAMPGNASMSTFRLGNHTNKYNDRNWNGSISEFIVYSRRLSDGEVAMAEAYLRRRFVL